MIENEKKKGPSRRDFLKGAGLFVAGGAVGTGLGYGASAPTRYVCPHCTEQFNTHDDLQAHVGATHVLEAASTAPEWPWPVNYGKEIELMTDVLVIGGGLAGSHAAINAAKKGAKVVVIDKGPISRSGSGGTGIDHWLGCLLNPHSQIDVPMLEMILNSNQGVSYEAGAPGYIMMRENWEALLDLEDWGMQIRDEYDEFAGAAFRDEASKLLFAYTYDTKIHIRLPGGRHMKTVLYNEMQRLRVATYDYTMLTSLLTEGGQTGARVIGATGLNIRTGEFYIIKAKATILATARPQKLWIFQTELNGSASSMYDPNNTGDGYAAAWRAGAEFINMEISHSQGPATGGFTYPPYGVGNAHNSWYACTIVDDDGKEIPWEDAQGNRLTTLEERYRSSSGAQVEPAGLIKDLPERIKNGEYKLPLYADLPGMPEMERRAIWGLQVGNEGKSRIPVYELYQRYGFDPDQDMLQVPVMNPEAYEQPVYWMGQGAPQYRETCFLSGYLLLDWDLRSNLAGLYAAGGICGKDGASGASATGRYAGRQAAAYAQIAPEPVIARDQVAAEKTRVYAPVTRPEGMGWKELKAGLCRIMQDYCGEYRSAATLDLGLHWFQSIRESEAATVFARNPRELARALECLTHITVGEMMMQASHARQASSRSLIFKRLDYPEMDPPEWQKILALRWDDGAVKVRELPLNFWNKPPFASTYQGNYEQHCNL